MTVVPKHWFSWDFSLNDRGGTPWGEVALSAWRERGSLRVGDQQYRVSRDGLLGPFVLTGPRGECVRATKVSPFRQAFTMVVGGRTYTLARLSIWRREFALSTGGSRVGSITPEGWFTRTAHVDLPDDLPPWARGFLVWLTLLMWKRDSDASS